MRDGLSQCIVREKRGPEGRTVEAIGHPIDVTGNTASMQEKGLPEAGVSFALRSK